MLNISWIISGIILLSKASLIMSPLSSQPLDLWGKRLDRNVVLVVYSLLQMQ